MPCRQIWEDVYALEVFETGTSLSDITGNDPAFTDTHGVRGDWTGTGTGDLTHKYNLLVDDAHPVVKAQNTVVEKNLVTGLSMENTVSVTQVVSQPDSVVTPVVFNAHNLSAFFWLFFQDGVTINAGTTNTALEILTCVPYADACPSAFGNLVRFRQDAGENNIVDQALKGVVPSRMVIRGEEGGLIEGEIEWEGAQWEDLELDALLATASGFDTTAPLKFEDLTVKIDDTAVSVPAFEVTFEAPVIQQYFNQISAQSVTQGRLSFTGNITLPWNEAYTIPAGTGQYVVPIKNFYDGTMIKLSLVWGDDTFTQFAVGDTGTTDYGGTDVLPANAKNTITNNYFAIHSYVRIMDYDENDIDENPMIPIDFKALVDDDGTIGGVTSYVAFDVTKNTWS
jgi:hypothetical protein